MTLQLQPKQPTLLPDDKVEFPHQVDSSMLSSFDACPMQFFRQYIEHWSPSARSVDLHAGGAFAAGIEAVRNTYYNEGKTIEEALNYGHLVLTKFWGDYESPEGHPKTYQNMAMALQDYFATYDLRMDPLKPYIRQDGSAAVEFKFALPTETLHPVTGDPVFYCGRFDMLGILNDQLYVVDEKTSKYSPRAEWMRQYAMRGQFIGYVWAARAHDFPAVGALVRMVVIQKTQFKYLQAPITVPNWQVDRWLVEMNGKVKRMLSYWNEAHWPLSYGDSCSSYSGCPYLDLCLQARPQDWVGDYTKRYWNPLAADPTAPPVAEEEIV